MVRWSVASKDAIEAAEKQLIKLSEVHIETTHIPVDETHSIFCAMMGDSANPPMIILHGWLCAGMMFYKMFKQLSSQYRVFVLDLMGMGRSTRPVFDAKDHEETEIFFVNPLEICRQYLRLDKMILVGHSFGGYIAGCYYERYPERVSKLVMLSPAGVSKASDDHDYETWLKSQSWFKRNILKATRYLWNKDLTPGSLIRFGGPIAGPVIKMFFKKSHSVMTDEEVHHIKVYFHHLNSQPGSGEFGLSRVLSEIQYAHNPLCERLKNIPTIFIYGEQDWMKSDGAFQNKAINRAPVIVETVSNSSHTLYLDNPKETSEKILNGLLKLDIMIQEAGLIN